MSNGPHSPTHGSDRQHRTGARASAGLHHIAQVAQSAEPEPVSEVTRSIRVLGGLHFVSSTPDSPPALRSGSFGGSGAPFSKMSASCSRISRSVGSGRLAQGRGGVVLSMAGSLFFCLLTVIPNGSQLFGRRANA